MARNEALDADAFELMKELVAVTGEKWVGASRFNTLADRWGSADLQQRIVFLTGAKRLLREVPVQVYADLDVRQSILAAAQDALDEAIDQEETDEEADDGLG